VGAIIGIVIGVLLFMMLVGMPLIQFFVEGAGGGM
jgi:hypothetical protein